MCRPDDFPPYEEWNGPVHLVGAGGSDAAGACGGALGDNPTELTAHWCIDMDPTKVPPCAHLAEPLVCDCGGDPDGFRHTMSLLHMALVNRKKRHGR